MKNIAYFFLIGFLLCIGTCDAQMSIQPDNKIVIGKVDQLHSKVLNEDRQILVYVPQISEFNPKHHYPVVYLLDGDDHFCSLMAMIQQLSEKQRNITLPQMIIIGIRNANRGRDFGGEMFTSFLENELIPYVDSVYSTSSYRILIGHSLGGLFTINTFINHSQLFKSYIAIDPSIDAQVLKQSEKALKEINFKDNSFYLAIANSPAVFFEDTTVNNRYRAILRLAHIFEENKNDNLNFSWKFYEDDNHTSVPFIAEYDGLRFIFSFYKFPDIKQLLNSSRPDSIINIKYQDISRIFGYKIFPPEGELLGLGYIFIEKKVYDKSYSIFKMLIDNFPESFMFYNAMGDLFRSKGDTMKALEYYEKSLSLNPNDGRVKDNINELKGKLKDKR